MQALLVANAPGLTVRSTREVEEPLPEKGDLYKIDELAEPVTISDVRRGQMGPEIHFQVGKVTANTLRSQYRWGPPLKKKKNVRRLAR